MEVLYPRCCGLDVHKSSITACVLIAQSGKLLKHIRRFGKKRAIIATARKLAVSLHHLWVSGEVYQPLHNSKPSPLPVAV